MEWLPSDGVERAKNLKEMAVGILKGAESGDHREGHARGLAGSVILLKDAATTHSGLEISAAKPYVDFADEINIGLWSGTSLKFQGRECCGRNFVEVPVV